MPCPINIPGPCFCSYSAGRIGDTVNPWLDEAGFVDKMAHWIWAVPDSYQNVPFHRTYSFMRTYNNPSSSPVWATVHCIVDNWGFFYLNGQLIGTIENVGWYPPAMAGPQPREYPKFDVFLQPGRNVFVFACYNTPQDWWGTESPAALAVAVTSGSTVLFHSDPDWIFAHGQCFGDGGSCQVGVVTMLLACAHSCGNVHASMLLILPKQVPAC